jgi:hypothetical protein
MSIPTAIHPIGKPRVFLQRIDKKLPKRANPNTSNATSLDRFQNNISDLHFERWL